MSREQEVEGREQREVPPWPRAVLPYAVRPPSWPQGLLAQGLPCAFLGEAVLGMSPGLELIKLALELWYWLITSLP